jgi:polyhydroxybutyrate depolymerase
MLSYVMACRASDRVAAIGPDGGYPVGQNAANCNPSVPVPVMHVHGANDNFVTFSGAAPWVKRFAEVNKCAASSATTNPSPGATKEDWAPCGTGNDVVFYAIAGMGHDYATQEKHGFNATEAFWTFFQAHPRR